MIEYELPDDERIHREIDVEGNTHFLTTYPTDSSQSQCDIWLSKKHDGWYYRVKKGYFRAEYGNFIGPEAALKAAKELVDVLLENFGI